MWSHISRTKTCLEAEKKKKELHLQWERENERRRARKEELEKELQRQVILRKVTVTVMLVRKVKVRKEELDKELQRQVKIKRGWGERSIHGFLESTSLQGACHNRQRK